MNKYEVIVSDIKKLIEEKKLLPGDKIFTERELIEKYEVSTTTVIKALSLLEREGLIIKKQGVGSFVNKSMKGKKVLFSEANLFDKNDGEDSEESVELYSMELCQRLDILELLEPRGEYDIISIKRLHKINDKVWRVQNNYISKRYFNEEDIETLKTNKSVSYSLKHNHNIDVFNIMFNQTMIVIDEYSPELKVVMRLKDKEPVLFFKRTNYTDSNLLFEYIETYVNYRYMEISIEPIR